MEKIRELDIDNYSYTTPELKLSLLAQYLPSFHFYARLMGVVYRSSVIARRGKYDAQEWRVSSNAVLNYLEDVGVHVRVSGLDYVQNLDKPCVIIGNHMSFLETVLLPCMILPKPVTFVVKQSLLEYPVFKHVMRARDPIAVSRTNPRQDLKVVLEQGMDRLQRGISVVVFPQSTRSHNFEPEKMSSIGIKLAKKAGVAVVPLALKTDALRNGRLLKDFGRIDPAIPVHFAFDAAIEINGRGGDEQEAVNAFIQTKLRQWALEISE